MKKFINNQYFAITSLMFVFATIFFFSCDKQEVEKVPSVHSIILSRIDTTIFPMGRYIDINGNGFDDVQSVLFNNLATYLNPNYVTSTHIVVQIPNDYPDEITNKVTLMTRSKASYEFDFTVNVPVPVINNVSYTLSKNLVTVEGQYLAKAKEVSVGGIIIKDYTISSDFKIITFNAVAGIPAGDVDVIVTCPPGSASSKFDLDKASSPAITEISCEWVDAGKTMQLNGRNLAFITTVFLNDIKVESGFAYNSDNSILQFPMPANIPAGSITVKVKNIFDKESTPYVGKYKTSEFTIWNFDDLNYCWGAPGSHLVTTDGVSSKYALWEGNISPSWWDQNNMFCGCGGPIPPTSITDNPSNYVLKFDVNVVNPWSVGSIRFSFNDDAISYDWIPYTVDNPYQTQGWKTISIPLSNWNFGTATLTGNYRLKFFTGGAPSDAVDVKIYFDNLRIDTK